MIWSNKTVLWQQSASFLELLHLVLKNISEPCSTKDSNCNTRSHWGWEICTCGHSLATPSSSRLASNTHLTGQKNGYIILMEKWDGTFSSKYYRQRRNKRVEWSCKGVKTPFITQVLALHPIFPLGSSCESQPICLEVSPKQTTSPFQESNPDG